MAGDNKSTKIPAGDAGTAKAAGGGAGGNPAPVKPKPGRPKKPERPINPDLLIPGTPGPKRKLHGAAAEQRATINARYTERKRAAAQGIPLPESPPVRPAGGTTPGYHKRLVKMHKQAARAMDMPELEIDTDEARELEQNALAVLSDKGITLRTEGANVFNLVISVLTIYGPIIVALWFRFSEGDKPAEPAQVQRPAQVAPAAPTPAAAHYAPPSQRVPDPPAAQEAQMPAFVPVIQSGAARTENDAQGRPETERQILPDGGAVHGAFFRTNGGLGPIS